MWAVVLRNHVYAKSGLFYSSIFFSYKCHSSFFGSVFVILGQYDSFYRLLLCRKGLNNWKDTGWYEGRKKKKQQQQQTQNLRKSYSAKLFTIIFMCFTITTIHIWGKKEWYNLILFIEGGSFQIRARWMIRETFFYCENVKNRDSKWREQYFHGFWFFSWVLLYFHGFL